MRGLIKWVGLFWIFAGLSLLFFVAFTYYQSITEERRVEELVPGQVADNPLAILTTVPTMVYLPSTTPITLDRPPLSTATPIEPVAEPTLATTIGPKGLALGEGTSAMRLIIPRIKLDTQVREATWAVEDENGTGTSEWQIPYDAVAHLSTTPQPGESGNAVFSGHHNLIAPDKFGLGKFAGLWNLKIGDPVYIVDDLGRIFLYRVASYYTLKELGEPLLVRMRHAQQILQDTGSPIATFETCWNGDQAPLSGNTYRWIVVTDLVGTVNPIQLQRMNN